MTTATIAVRRPLSVRVGRALAVELDPVLRVVGDRITRTLAVGLLLAQLLDVLTTTVLLGPAHIEANPLSAAVIGAWGFAGLLAVKGALAVGITLYAAGFERRTTRLLLACATVLSFAVVAWNLAIA